jgi:hypothetical protein
MRFKNSGETVMDQKISPAEIELSALDGQAFSATGFAGPVRWSIPSKIGSIDDHGIYQAPEKVDNPRSVIVLASAAEGLEYATAVVWLSDRPKPITFLGLYGVVASLLLVSAVLLFLRLLNQPILHPMVLVNPPIVTLDPEQANDSEFQFTATVLGDPKNAVIWSSDDSQLNNPRISTTGGYRPKQPNITSPKTITVRATSVSDPNVSATAVVNLVPGRHLEVTPQSVSAFTSQQIPFRVLAGDKDGDVTWSVSREELGKMSENGTYTVNGAIKRQEPITIKAVSKTSPPIEGAAVLIVNSPYADGVPTNSTILLFVIVVGSLGSMLYYASSFVDYVGNRTFRSSWFWFYVFRPVVGGILAAVFFFIVGSGLISGTTTSDLMKLAMISALVGLFSDKAVKKLSDILDVILQAKDERKDKLPQDAAQGPATSGKTVAPPTPKPAPEITKSEPSMVKKGVASAVKFTGSDFKPKSVIKVNGREITPVSISDQVFLLELQATDVGGDKAVVTITNEDGTSTPFVLKVEP